MFKILKKKGFEVVKINLNAEFSQNYGNKSQQFNYRFSIKESIII
jgi:hypothetical protein